MTLTDLMNNHYTRGVREAMLDLILGRSDKVVKVGDVVEMLLSISFAIKDAMLDWEWLGIDEKEWPQQRLDWDIYRIEHLSFASNMEAQFARWQQPWHILYSALRCMSCQEWQKQHVCPICRHAVRNSGGTHDACGRPMIPSVAELLAELYPKRGAREWLPMLTIIYMAPGGHRQWPMSITALLERLSWIVLQTRSLALSHFQAAVQRNPKRKRRYRCGPRVAVAPPTPFKFLDIVTGMGCYHIGEHIPGRNETDNVFHPRLIGNGIPPDNTFHAVIYERAEKCIQDSEDWCLEEAWFAMTLHIRRHSTLSLGTTSSCSNMSEEAFRSRAKKEVCGHCHRHIACLII